MAVNVCMLQLVASQVGLNVPSMTNRQASMYSSYCSLAKVLPTTLLALVLSSTPTFGLVNASWSNNGPSNASYDISVGFSTSTACGARSLTKSQPFSSFVAPGIR